MSNVMTAKKTKYPIGLRVYTVSVSMVNNIYFQFSCTCLHASIHRTIDSANLQMLY